MRSAAATLVACAIVLCAVVAGAGYALGWSVADDESVVAVDAGATMSETSGVEPICLVYLAGEGWTDDAALGGCVQAVSLALPDGVSGSISYRVDGADSGWGDWASDGEVAGAADGSEAVAGLAVRLSGEAADAYDVWYRVWVDGYGWTGWAQNGWPVGSGSAGAAVEAVEVLLLPAGSAAPGDVTPAVITSAATNAATDVAAGDEAGDEGEVGDENASAETAGNEAANSEIASDETASDETASAEAVDEEDVAVSSDADGDVAEDASSREADADGADATDDDDDDDDDDSVIVIIVGGDSDDDAGDATEEAATITVTISIDASRAEPYGYDVSVAATTLVLEEGATVYDALCALGVSVGGTSTYVSSIAGLAEFACGSGSGWMYSVDGVYPNVACGKYELAGGEVIVWVYTCDLGNDL